MLVEQYTTFYCIISLHMSYVIIWQPGSSEHTLNAKEIKQMALEYGAFCIGFTEEQMLVSHDLIYCFTRRIVVLDMFMLLKSTSSYSCYFISTECEIWLLLSVFHSPDLWHISHTLFIHKPDILPSVKKKWERYLTLKTFDRCGFHDWCSHERVNIKPFHLHLNTTCPAAIISQLG